MAKLTPSDLIHDMSGKLSPTERVSMRTRFGKVHTYTYRHPSTAAPAESQLKARERFSESRRQAKLELQDPVKHAEWLAKFKKQKRYVRLDCFVSAELLKAQNQ